MLALPDCSLDLSVAAICPEDDLSHHLTNFCKKFSNVNDRIIVLLLARIDRQAENATQFHSAPYLLMASLNVISEMAYSQLTRGKDLPTPFQDVLSRTL